MTQTSEWKGAVQAEPDFNNLLKVLRRETPGRPTLFEFFLNSRLYGKLAGDRWTDDPSPLAQWRGLIAAFRAAGYDYATVNGSPFRFPGGEHERVQTLSLNQGFVITDRKSFDAYPWPDVEALDYTTLQTVAPDLPRGMKLIVCGPGGVLENVISLLGFDNLCFLLADDPVLVTDVFEQVGRALVRHYERAAAHNTVGACISNDDWGFKTQTMLSVADMRRYVFPWHVKIVEAIHAAGKPAILHSCGQAREIMDDIITLMRYDGKHSYEDVIMPVEEAYARWGSRIAILGGIDLDFIMRSSGEEIFRRSRAMIEQAAAHGSYALGTGNSVPSYIDDEKYFAMIRAATDLR
jgi:uroporphyrinogen decarboxylase